jgi:hypothetical protein
LAYNSNTALIGVFDAFGGGTYYSRYWFNKKLKIEVRKTAGTNTYYKANYGVV